MGLFDDFFEGGGHGRHGHGHHRDHDDHDDDHDRDYDHRRVSAPRDLAGPGGPERATCAGCGAGVVLMAGFRFCPYCGAALGRACVSCRKSLAPGAAFCGACGARA